MITEEAWQFVERHLDLIESRKEETGALCDDLKISIRSLLFGPFIEAEISLIEALAFLVEDHYNVIQKWIFEGNFGKNPDCPIKNFNELRKTIEESRNVTVERNDAE